MSILDPQFKYAPAVSTNVVNTWKKFGFKPTTDEERIAREEKRAALYAPRESRELPSTRNDQATAKGFSLRLYEGASPSR